MELEKLTVKKLREIALEIPDISGVHGMKKEELIEAIRAHRPDMESETAVVREKKVKVELNKSELKKKIRLLKQERDKGLEAKNPEAVSKIRKKIKSLKRKLQKVA